jgi:hypothetical protein
MQQNITSLAPELPGGGKVSFLSDTWLVTAKTPYGNSRSTTLQISVYIQQCSMLRTTAVNVVVISSHSRRIERYKREGRRRRSACGGTKHLCVLSDDTRTCTKTHTHTHTATSGTVAVTAVTKGRNKLGKSVHIPMVRVRSVTEDTFH